MSRGFHHRLDRLFRELARHEPTRFRIVWDEEEIGPHDGPVIRLRWPDDLGRDDDDERPTPPAEDTP